MTQLTSFQQNNLFLDLKALEQIIFVEKIQSGHLSYTQRSSQWSVTIAHELS